MKTNVAATMKRPMAVATKSSTNVKPRLRLLLLISTKPIARARWRRLGAKGPTSSIDLWKSQEADHEMRRVQVGLTTARRCAAPQSIARDDVLRMEVGAYDLLALPTSSNFDTRYERTNEAAFLIPQRSSRDPNESHLVVRFDAR